MTNDGSNSPFVIRHSGIASGPFPTPREPIANFGRQLVLLRGYRRGELLRQARSQVKLGFDRGLHLSQLDDKYVLVEMLLGSVLNEQSRKRIQTGVDCLDGAFRLVRLQLGERRRLD